MILHNVQNQGNKSEVQYGSPSKHSVGETLWTSNLGDCTH